MFRRMLPPLILFMALPACAQEPKPPMITPEEQKLAAEADKLHFDAFFFYQRGQTADAVSKARASLAIRRKIYPVATYPDGHPDLANSLNGLGVLLQTMASYEPARLHLEESLAMRQK